MSDPYRLERLVDRLRTAQRECVEEGSKEKAEGLGIAISWVEQHKAQGTQAMFSYRDHQVDCAKRAFRHTIHFEWTPPEPDCTCGYEELFGT